MLGRAWFQAPALVHEDPSGIYEGETVTEGVTAQFTPPAEVRCTGSTCTVSSGCFETGVEVAAEDPRPVVIVGVQAPAATPSADDRRRHLARRVITPP